jgi:hypothetical protein
LIVSFSFSKFRHENNFSTSGDSCIHTNMSRGVRSVSPCPSVQRNERLVCSTVTIFST